MTKTAGIEPNIESKPLTPAETATKAEEAHTDAVAKRQAMHQRYQQLQAQLSALTVERRSLSARLVSGDTSVGARLDEIESQQRERGRELEGLEVLLRDAQELVDLTNKAREQAVVAWQRNELISSFDDAKKDAHAAFAQLREHFTQACVALGSYCYAIDRADTAARELGSPYNAMREELITKLLDPPYPTLQFWLRARGYREKLGGWGQNWIVQINPLIPPPTTGIEKGGQR
jgi:hypothetical protein